MIFAAAPVRLAPNGGSLCRRDAGYSSFSTPECSIYRTIVSHFRRLSRRFLQKIPVLARGDRIRDQIPSQPSALRVIVPGGAAGPAVDLQHIVTVCGQGADTGGHHPAVALYAVQAADALGVQGPGKGVPGLRIGEGDGIGGLRIQRRIGGDDHRPLRGGIWAVPEKGPEIQIGRLPGTVHGPAVGAGNGHMGQGAPPAVGSERGTVSSSEAGT